MVVVVAIFRNTYGYKPLSSQYTVEIPLGIFDIAADLAYSRGSICDKAF
jgi:hypothetical protein